MRSLLCAALVAAASLRAARATLQDCAATNDTCSPSVGTGPCVFSNATCNDACYCFDLLSGAGLTTFAAPFEAQCLSCCSTALCYTETLPSLQPSAAPSEAPSEGPSSPPSSPPSARPSAPPSGPPTGAPSFLPTALPSAPPTRLPSDAPSLFPTAPPSAAPTGSPSSGMPSGAPSPESSAPPSARPSSPPSGAPTASKAPSGAPSAAPSGLMPTPALSAFPTATLMPSGADESSAPSEQPTGLPSSAPSSAPSFAPTANSTSGGGTSGGSVVDATSSGSVQLALILWPLVALVLLTCLAGALIGARRLRRRRDRAKVRAGGDEEDPAAAPLAPLAPRAAGDGAAAPGAALEKVGSSLSDLTASRELPEEEGPSAGSPKAAEARAPEPPGGAGAGGEERPLALGNPLTLDAAAASPGGARKASIVGHLPQLRAEAQRGGSGRRGLSRPLPALASSDSHALLGNTSLEASLRIQQRHTPKLYSTDQRAGLPQLAAAKMAAQKLQQAAASRAERRPSHWERADSRRDLGPPDGGPEAASPWDEAAAPAGDPLPAPFDDDATTHSQAEAIAALRSELEASSESDSRGAAARPGSAAPALADSVRALSVQARSRRPSHWNAEQRSQRDIFASTGDSRRDRSRRPSHWKMRRQESEERAAEEAAPAAEEEPSAAAAALRKTWFARLQPQASIRMPAKDDFESAGEEDLRFEAKQAAGSAFSASDSDSGDDDMSLAQIDDQSVRPESRRISRIERGGMWASSTMDMPASPDLGSIAEDGAAAAPGRGAQRRQRRDRRSARRKKKKAKKKRSPPPRRAGATDGFEPMAPDLVDETSDDASVLFSTPQTRARRGTRLVAMDLVEDHSGA